MLPRLHNTNYDYNIQGVTSTTNNHSNFYAINLLCTKLQYYFSYLKFLFDEFRQTNSILSWIFSESFLQWKKNLQQRTNNHDLWNKVVVSSIIATSTLYRYIKEILVLAYILYYFNPDILSGILTYLDYHMYMLYKFCRNLCRLFFNFLQSNLSYMGRC